MLSEGVSLAETKAAEINESLESLGRKWLLESKAAARDGGPMLYGALSANVEGQITTFSGRVLAAKDLSFQPQGESSFIVLTQTFPMVRLEVNRIALGINSRLLIHRQALGPAKQGIWKLYPFAADQNLEPCFSDYDNELSPGQLADILLTPVFEAFEP